MKGKKYHARCHDCHEYIDTNHKPIADAFVKAHQDMKHVAKVYVAKGS